MKLSLPVVSSLPHLKALPLFYTQLGMVSTRLQVIQCVDVNGCRALAPNLNGLHIRRGILSKLLRGFC